MYLQTLYRVIVLFFGSLQLRQRRWRNGKWWNCRGPGPCGAIFLTVELMYILRYFLRFIWVVHELLVMGRVHRANMQLWWNEFAVVRFFSVSILVLALFSSNYGLQVNGPQPTMPGTKETEDRIRPIHSLHESWRKRAQREQIFSFAVLSWECGCGSVEIQAKTQWFSCCGKPVEANPIHGCDGSEECTSTTRSTISFYGGPWKSLGYGWRWDSTSNIVHVWMIFV